MTLPTKRQGLTKSNALKMYQRDADSGFLADYKASIEVTRAEAPSQSSPGLLHVSKLARDLHPHSQGELAGILNALHLPALFDLHDHKLLQVSPAPHPLAKHPSMAGITLPTVPGTLSICEELGIRHPIGRDDTAPIGQPPKHIFYPFVGDLLLILSNAGGDLYCVNWTIKRSTQQFGIEPNFVHPANFEMYKSKTKAARRLEMEIRYYAAAGIPTFPIAFDDFNPIVTRNLFRIFCWAQRAPDVEMNKWTEIVRFLNAGLNNKHSVNSLSEGVALKFHLPITIASELVYKAIWHRNIRVDLFQTIFPDRPLCPESVDLVEQIYKKWIRPQ